MLKKSLLVLLALAFILPVLTAEAAYILVPNFRDITSNKIERRIDYQGTDHLSYNGVNYTRWNYEVVDGREDEYIDKYIRKCSSRHDLQLLGRNGSDWFFLYTGGQAKFIKKLGDKFHMHVGISGSHVVVDLVGGMYPQ